MNNSSFIYFVQIFYFSLVGSFSSVMNENANRGHTGLVLGLKEKVVNISPYEVSCLLMEFLNRYSFLGNTFLFFSFYFMLLRVLFLVYMKLNIDIEIIKRFSALVKMTVCIFPFILLMWCITLYSLTHVGLAFFLKYWVVSIRDFI